jgi:hypothetical protein
MLVIVSVTAGSRIILLCWMIPLGPSGRDIVADGICTVCRRRWDKSAAVTTVNRAWCSLLVVLCRLRACDRHRTRRWQAGAATHRAPRVSSGRDVLCDDGNSNPGCMPTRTDRGRSALRPDTPRKGSCQTHLSRLRTVSPLVTGSVTTVLATPPPLHLSR